MLHNIVLDYKPSVRSAYLDEEIMNLGELTFVIPDYYEYQIIEVSERSQGRPDLLSYDLYGDTMYGGLLCKLNNIPNPFEMNAGDRIVAPTATYLDRFIVMPTSNEDEPATTDTPKPKRKNEKRKPNEAIVGDKRFKVDTERRLVIY